MNEQIFERAAVPLEPNFETQLADMGPPLPNPLLQRRRGDTTYGRWLAATLVPWLTIAGTLRAAEPRKAFATPEEAVSALDQAVNTTNRATFALLFGPGNDWLC